MSGDDTVLNSDTVAPTANPFKAPLTKPAAPPLGRSYAAGAAEERRSPQPRKLDKQWTKALDNAADPEPTSVVKHIELNNTVSTGTPIFKLHSGVAGTFHIDFDAKDPVLLTAISNLPDADRERLGKPKHDVKVNWRVKWTRNGKLATAIEVTTMAEQQTLVTPTDNGRKSETPVTAPAPVKMPHWADADKERKSVFGSWTNLCDAHKVKEDKEFREGLRKRYQQAEHMNQTPFLNKDALVKHFKNMLDKEFPTEGVTSWGHNSDEVEKFWQVIEGEAASFKIVPSALRTKTFMTLAHLYKTTDFAELDPTLSREAVQAAIVADWHETTPEKPTEQPKDNQGAATMPANRTQGQSIPENENKGTVAPASGLSVEPGTVADKAKEIREKFNQPQRGKDYLTVQGRVALFRLKFAMGTIDTELINLDGEAAVFKARIAIDGVILATGYARATAASTKNLGGRFIEKAETAAVGRALAMAGFGTDDSLDDSDFLSDSPIARAA